MAERVTLSAETAVVSAWIDDLASALSGLPKPPEGLVDLIFDAFEALVELRGVDVDAGAAAAAGQLTVALEPTELGRRLVAALRAGNGDLGAIQVELERHVNASAGGVEPPPGDGESPGPSSDGPGDGPGGRDA
ncbi:MAG: hypothetical protein ACOY5Y_07120 [Pseudomonadota bacterium]